LQSMAIDPVWETLFAARAWGMYPSEAVIRGVMRTLGARSPRSGAAVLDLGTGPGANTWFLAREGFTVAGMDGSPTAIAQNRQRLAAEGLSADLRVGDITAALPWQEGTFDLVLDHAALYANPLSAIRRALTSVREVLKPGGHVLSLSFTTKTWGHGMGRAAEEPGAFMDITEGPLAGKGYVQFLSREDIGGLFSAFTDLQVEQSSYTLEHGRRLIESWVVLGRKPGY